MEEAPQKVEMKLLEINNPESQQVEKKTTEKRFAGLGNQGATCYMNSLL